MSLSPLKILIAAALLSALPALAQSSDTLYTKRAAELRKTPDDKAASVTSLPAQAALTRTTLRVGPWIQVKTADAQTGWVHMFDVGASPGSAGSGSNTATGALRGLTALFGGGARQSTTATSTVGIRGLDAEDIANAQPNLAALTRAEGLRQDAGQARRFASEAQLAAREVDNLPEPAPPQAANPSNRPRTLELTQ